MTLRHIAISCLLAFFLALFAAPAVYGQQVFSYRLPDSLPASGTQTLENLRTLGRQLNMTAQKLQIFATDLASLASDDRRRTDELVHTAENDSMFSKEIKSGLEKAAKLRKLDERDALRRQKAVDQLVRQTARLEELDSVQLQKVLPRIFTNLQENIEILNAAAALHEKRNSADAEIAAMIQANSSRRDTTPPAPEVSADTVIASKPEIVVEKKAPPRPQPRDYATYTPAVDVMLNPPRQPCKMALEVRDEFSGEWRRELTSEEFFRAAARNGTLAKPALIVDAHLGLSGVATALHLTLRVYDSALRRSFGSLALNSVATLKLLDGTTATLYNLRADDGVADPTGQFVVYRGQYPIDPATLKNLRRKGVDKIRIGWSAGYADYEIHNVDLLQRQIPCLEK